MGSLYIYFGLLCVLTVVVQSHGTDKDDLKHRLSALEETLLRVVERNNDLAERNTNLEKRVASLESENRIFRNTLELMQKEPRCPDKEIKNENQADKPMRKLNDSITKTKKGDGHVSEKKHTSFRRQANTINTVAFTAVVHPPRLNNLGASQTVIYDKIITNIGDAYHSRTGIFTAPLNGVYVFNFASMISPGQNEYLELTKYGQYVMDNYGHASGAPHYISPVEQQHWNSKLEMRSGFVHNRAQLTEMESYMETTSLHFLGGLYTLPIKSDIKSHNMINII